MIGDKLVIEEHHTKRATEICDFLSGEIGERFTISIAGESGSGKSELASEIARIMSERGIPSAILQQDDYFVFPPRTNHKMRKRNIEQVGTYEVKLDFLDCNLRSYRRSENPIYKPLVIFDEDRITTEELDLSGIRLLIAEGTYTSVLQFIDRRIFIDRNYMETLESRKKRARDSFEPFMEEVLWREHEIISSHRRFADMIIPASFDRVERVERGKGRL